MKRILVFLFLILSISFSYIEEYYPNTATDSNSTNVLSNVTSSDNVYATATILNSGTYSITSVFNTSGKLINSSVITQANVSCEYYAEGTGTINIDLYNFSTDTWDYNKLSQATVVGEETVIYNASAYISNSTNLTYACRLAYSGPIGSLVAHFDYMHLSLDNSLPVVPNVTINSPTNNTQISAGLSQNIIINSSLNMTGCFIEFGGTNYTGSVDATNKSCNYTFAMKGGRYDYRGFVNVSGIMYVTNETRRINFEAPSTLTECQTIISAGCYQISSSLDAQGSKCIIVDASTVAFACNGHPIYNATTGIEVKNQTGSTKLQNVKVFDCDINGSSYGIYYDANHTTNSAVCLLSYDISENNINLINPSSGIAGIYIVDGDNITAYGNSITKVSGSNKVRGMFIGNGIDNSQIYTTTINTGDGTTYAGFEINNQLGRNNLISTLTISNTALAIKLSSSTNNSLEILSITNSTNAIVDECSAGYYGNNSFSGTINTATTYSFKGYGNNCPINDTLSFTLINSSGTIYCQIAGSGTCDTNLDVNYYNDNPFTESVIYNFTGLGLYTSEGYGAKWSNMQNELVNNTNGTLINDTFISINSSLKSSLNKTATVRLYVAGCDGLSFHTKDEFPQTYNEIIANGTVYTPSSYSCSGNTVEFTVSSFSGYAVVGYSRSTTGSGSSPPTPEPTSEETTTQIIAEQIPTFAQGVVEVIDNIIPGVVKQTYRQCAIRKTGPIEWFNCEYTGLLSITFFDSFSMGLLFLIILIVAFAVIIDNTTKRKNVHKIPQYLTIIGTITIFTLITIGIILANNILIVQIAKLVG